MEREERQKMINQESETSICFPCIEVKQPLGNFYIASIQYKTICEITDFDVRRLTEERGFETYLGIQRPLNKSRVKEIGEYVNTVDACFPTSIVLSVEGRCAEYNEQTGELTLHNIPNPEDDEKPVLYREIAKVLDGQHRIEALKNCSQQHFDLNVSIFIDADLADQAYIFSTVNLAQTKVNKSLVMDLYDLAKFRSPQKVAHHIVVALDQTKGSPFYKRIKRLGVSTYGRTFETTAQATFTQELLKYFCKNELEQMRDRDIYKRGHIPDLAQQLDSEQLIFRNMFINQLDNEITDVLWNYFESVSIRWKDAWNKTGRGFILNKTTGFKSLMRFLRDAYLYCTAPGGVPSTTDFLKIFRRINLNDEAFTTDNYKPGSSGQAQLYRDLLAKSNLDVDYE